jgi:hypothetical protein
LGQVLLRFRVEQFRGWDVNNTGGRTWAAPASETGS